MCRRTALLFVAICMPCLSEERLVDFSRDVLPVLSDNCFQCHGPDEANRESGLRLDQEDGVYAELDSGEYAIVPGDASSSALVRRISATDPDLKMPPVDSGKTLSEDQIDLIRKWVESGAQWSDHWAFTAPSPPSVPDPTGGWVSHGPIDRFIQRRLQQEGLSPAARASKEALIRRATLDLIGLPATLKEIDDFLDDRSSAAFERVVDRLLNTARYGEHMARQWLDAARYADTHGLHLDNERSIWPYRDWVIKAFNANVPFDQFTIEQLAGDLLPAPTLEQIVATGFNRCNVTTSEGGSIDDEYYARYAVDRVETTSTVWLGLTAGCAACHDHKFDPLTQKEFYQLFSYFFSLTEKAMDGNALLPPPVVKVPGPQHVQQRTTLETQLASVRRQIEEELGRFIYEDPLEGEVLGEIDQSDDVWFDDELPDGAEPSGDGQTPWQFVVKPAPVFSGSKSIVRSSKELSQHLFSNAKETLTIGPHDRLFIHVYLDPDDPPEMIQLQFNDGSWEHRAYWGADKGYGKGKKGSANHHAGDLPTAGEWARLEVAAGAVGLSAGAKVTGWACSQYGGTVHWDLAGRVDVAPLAQERRRSLHVWEEFHKRVKYPSLPPEVGKLIKVARSERSDAQRRSLTQYFLKYVNPESRDVFEPFLSEEEHFKTQLSDLEKSIPSTLVMKERDEPRQAYVLDRGQYTEKRDAVSSQVPGWLLPPAKDAAPNRLGLARWLVDPAHPLTARVTVNRYWQQFFGTGLVKTSEDFGVQGEQPSHPELLDWLAIQFIESGWDVKLLLKAIMMSSTYQQTSQVTPELLAIDPENRLLARGPRFRLDAEVIRDQALAVSGLLIPTIGGASVKPYQPAGLWKPVGFGGSNTSVFKQDTGSKLYRRSMYTFWKRTSPPPSMSAFDAPDRETCQVRRARTNTPLQALVLMNDVQFFEAARKFAERVLLEGGDDIAERLTFAFRCVTARTPTSNELSSLTRLLEACERQLRQDAVAAGKLISAGESVAAGSIAPRELSAWTMVAHLLLNLSEAVTKG